MHNLHTKLDLPFVLHNRYWAVDNLYKQNYSFVVEDYEALPTQVR